MNEPDLRLIASTKGLYAPPAGGRLLFMLAKPPSPPPGGIPFESTWADQGAPTEEGWYVIVPEVPEPADAVVLETHLRSTLSGDRGIAWSSLGAKPTVIGQVPIELGSGDAPVVSADAPFSLPTGIPPLTIPAGLALAATAPGPSTLGLASPGVAPSLGLAADLTGSTAGCLRFRALLASPVQGERSVKPLAAVRLDPLDPWDPQRTSISPLGPEYALVREAARYRLEGVAA